MRRSDCRAVWWAWVCVAAACLPVHAQRDASPMPGDYRVIDGRVDRGTYVGWRLFHSACFGCHGVGGGGTAVAPNLLERIPNMTRATLRRKC